MTISKTKLDICLAKAAINASDLKSVDPRTYWRAASGKELRPKSVGKLAKELGVSVEDLIDKEER